MNSRAWIKTITMNDDQIINCNKNGIHIFVGPNNVGKSRMLNELEQLCRRKNDTSIIIKEISIEQEGSEDDVVNDIRNFSQIKINNSSPLPTYIGFQYSLYEGSIKSDWRDAQTDGLKDTAGFFVLSADTVNRITSSNPPQNIDFATQGPNHPIHLLVQNESLMEKLNTYFKQAFNQDLILNYRAGNIIPLHVGQPPNKEGNEDRVSDSFVKKLNQLPRLEVQGDGMRAFVGILLTLLCTPQQIIFIDEPEAFLHPPQAKLLGEILAQNNIEKQLFVSTHSIDFILGSLNGQKEISITRINRKEGKNPTQNIEESKIRDIWSNPLLRFSNILDGLFYNKVIICESESDSMFYQAVAYLVQNNYDTFFTNANGKGQIDKIIKALKITGVETHTIIDIDILLDNKKLKKIWESLGGNWNDISEKYSIIKGYLDATLKRPSREKIKEILKPFLDNTSETLNEEDIHILNMAISYSKESKLLKEKGFNIFDEKIRGNFDELNNLFIEKGLHLVPVGELENFDSEIKEHGPSWTEKALIKLKNREEYHEAKIFISGIINL
jgi:energy-coupling factor transporter ATP-binding protein EcfA2